MRNRISALLLAGLLTLLAGCSLARPEPGQGSGPGGDRMVGVYIVREAFGQGLDRSHWVEYGSFQADTEWGAIDLPQRILIGEYDEEEHTYHFPGVEGHALFVQRMGEGTDGSIASINDLAEGSFHVKHTDGGESFELSGTLYYGPPADDPDFDRWDTDGSHWTFYQVYRMDDGTIYLNGHGNSFGGGGGVSTTTTETETVSFEVNGERKTEELYTKIEANIEYVDRLDSLTLRQYGADGVLLDSATLSEGELLAREEGHTVSWLPDAAWAVAEELRAGDLTRTLYDRPPAGGDPVGHQIVLLEEDGMGRVEFILFE